MEIKITKLILIKNAAEVKNRANMPADSLNRGRYLTHVGAPRKRKNGGATREEGRAEGT